MSPLKTWTCARVFVILLLVGAVSGCRSAATDPTSSAPPPVPPQGEAADYWQNALEEIYKSPLELQAQHATELRRGIHIDKLMQGDARKRQVALTFDDGPHPDFTPQLLAILAQHGVKATFFLVGEKAEQAPDLVRAETAAGHSVGNHTYHHVNLTRIPNRLVATEIKACGDAIAGITGRAPHLFRPPGGDYDLQVAETVNQLGYKLILWTDDPGDYADPGQQVVVNRTLRHLGDGGIILIHDGATDTVKLLPVLLDDIKRRGFECVTIDQMIQQGR